MIKIGNRKARCEFFSQKNPTEVKKGNKIETSAKPRSLVRMIGSVGCDEYISLPKNYDFVPLFWKIGAESTHLNDLVNHGPFKVVNTRNKNLSSCVREALYEVRQPHARYRWYGPKGSRDFRIEKIFSASAMYDGFELIGEDIVLEGTCQEIRCVIPSKSTKDHMEYDFIMRGIPIDGKDPREVEGFCYCGYKKFYPNAHYRSELCEHEILSLWEIKRRKEFGMSHDIIPLPNEESKDFYRKCMDNVLKGGKPLAKTQIDIMLQYGMIEYTPDRFFEFG